jgi:hypothetical protein
MSRLPGILLLSALCLSGCVTPDSQVRDETIYIGGSRTTYGQPPPHSNKPPGREDAVSYWNGDGLSGSPSIKIRLSEQRAYFYKGGKLAGVSTVSTGREGFHTATGSFQIIQKDRDHVSSRFGDYVDGSGNIIKSQIDTEKDPRPKGAHYDGARMPFFMRIVGGTGMHEGFLPGYPASHGCIRMPGFMAEKFFEHVNLGTPVTVSE